MNDLISRQAAIEVVQKRHIMLNKEKVLLINDLEKLPTAEPERLKGEWEIKKSTIHPYGNDVCCSICGHTMGSTFGYRFCPMCGADMRGEQ